MLILRTLWFATERHVTAKASKEHLAKLDLTEFPEQPACREISDPMGHQGTQAKGAHAVNMAPWGKQATEGTPVNVVP